MDRKVSFVDNEPTNESALNLNSLIQRAMAEQDSQANDDCYLEYISHRKTKIICSLGQQTNNFVSEGRKRQLRQMITNL